MTRKIPIHEQIAGVERAYGQAANLTKTELDGCAAAIKTLKWLRDNRQAIELAMTILKDDGAAVVLEAFKDHEPKIERCSQKGWGYD